MSRLGLYGKLPTLGDFVSRGFSRQLVDGLDATLRSSLGRVIAEVDCPVLSDSAQTVVLSVLPGVLCRSGFVGCVLPSQDIARRFFPLCVGLETDVEGGVHQSEAHAWPSLTLTVQLCRIALEAQALGLGPDELLEQLPSQDLWTRLQESHRPFVEATDVTVPPLQPSVNQIMFEGPERGMSASDLAICTFLLPRFQVIGAAVSTGTHFDRFFAIRELAASTGLSAVLDERWTHWGWTVRKPGMDEDEFPTELGGIDGK